MARIIPLYPKKEKTDQSIQPAPSHGFLPEDLERLRKRIMGDILNAFKSIIRKVVMFPYKQWMTAEHVQMKLNVSAGELRRMSDAGEIRFEELCGDYYYDAKDVARVGRRKKRLRSR
jgi:hypothetical protein